MHLLPQQEERSGYTPFVGVLLATYEVLISAPADESVAAALMTTTTPLLCLVNFLLLDYTISRRIVVERRLLRYVKYL